MKEKKKPKPPRLYLRVRRHTKSAWVVMWLMERDGPSDGCVLYGPVMECRVRGIAEALGLEVEEEGPHFRMRKSCRKALQEMVGLGVEL